MPQSIEKQREVKSPEVAVTVMFCDRRVFLGVIDSFRARRSAATSLPGELTVGDPVVAPIISLPSHPKVSVSGAHSRHRMRRKTSPHIEKFSTEGLMARSDLVVLAANPNTSGPTAAATVITTMTEQRRCVAA